MDDTELARDSFVKEKLNISRDELQGFLDQSHIIRSRREKLAQVRASGMKPRCPRWERVLQRYQRVVLGAATLQVEFTDFIERKQLAGVLIATASLAASAGFWIMLMPMWPSPGWPAGLSFMFLAAVSPVIYLRFKVPYVKDRRDNVRVMAETVEAFQSRLREAWPRGRPDLADECPEQMGILRAELVEDLASMKYYDAGALLVRLFEARDSRDLAAAYALLDYIEESPFLRRVFDAVRGYADGSLYSSYTPHEIVRWVEDRVQEVDQRAEWSDWKRERAMARLGKRLLDVVVAGSFLIMMTFVVPILPVTVILLRFEDTDPPLPIIMKTLRIGMFGRPFRYFRFRARISRTELGKIVPGPVSRFLLVTGLDKAPSLVNVLAGDMSLVGPHPLHWCHYQQVTRQGVSPEVWLRRLRVRPGLTGPSQIVALRSPDNGFRCVDYLVRDVEYAAQWSVPGDIMYLVEQAGETVKAGARLVQTPPAQLLRAHTRGAHR